MAGQAEALLQLCQNLVRTEPQMGQHDQRMKPQVGSFTDQRLGVSAGVGVTGGEQGFHRFLADLLSNLGHAAVEKAAAASAWSSVWVLSTTQAALSFDPSNRQLRSMKEPSS